MALAKSGVPACQIINKNTCIVEKILLDRRRWQSIIDKTKGY
jgi:hypothetical protein